MKNETGGFALHLEQRICLDALILFAIDINSAMVASPCTVIGISGFSYPYSQKGG